MGVENAIPTSLRTHDGVIGAERAMKQATLTSGLGSPLSWGPCEKVAAYSSCNWPQSMSGGSGTPRVVWNRKE